MSANSTAGISIFMIAKNSEKDLDDCLRLARPVADELVVAVDASSTDATADVARSHTDKVWIQSFEGFSAMKNFALSKCTRQWAFNLDTDERLTPQLSEDLNFVKTSGPDSTHGYAVNRLPYFLGSPIRHGGWYPDWVLRLVRRERASYPPRRVHERLEVSGETARLRGVLIHYTARSWGEFLSKQRAFARLSEVPPSCWNRLTHPPAAFLKSALWQFGFLDGWRGLAVAFARSYYTYYKYCK